MSVQAPAARPTGAGVRAPAAVSSPAGEAQRLPPSPEAGPVLGAVAKRDFSVQLGVAFRSFAAGEMVTDRVLVEALIVAQAPIDVVRDQEDLIQCPHCKRMLTINMAVGAED